MIRNAKRKAKNVKLNCKRLLPNILNNWRESLTFALCVFSFALCVLRFASCIAFAQSISSAELINNAKQYDNKTVIYQGEVIGDIMERKEFAWLNVNDGANAIGIWIDKNFTKNISYAGSYKSRGDIVEVEGVFHRSCPEHGGDLDIHAIALRKIKSGMIVAQSLDIFKRNLAFLLLGVLCLILILTLLKRK